MATGASGESSAIYLGVLTPATSSTTAPCIEAVLAPRLIACVPPEAHGAVSIVSAPSVLGSGAFDRMGKVKKPKPKKVRRQEWQLCYYVCTLDECGWRGPTPSKHSRQKPKCPGQPSILYHERSTSAKEAAETFLARCTPQQRKLGLPPDGAKPIPLPGADGQIDPHVLYLTVPIGLAGGDTFTVPMGRGMEAKVVVPPGKQEGDVLAISAHAGRRSGAAHEAPRSAEAEEEEMAADSGGGPSASVVVHAGAAAAATAARVDVVLSRSTEGQEEDGIDGDEAEQSAQEEEATNADDGGQWGEEDGAGL